MSETAPTPRVDYVVVEGDVRRDRDTVIAVCRANLRTGARFAVKYDWFYLACPFGEPLIELLYFGEECVGIATIGRRRMLLDGAEVRAGVLVDLVVDAKHRSLGPALTLQRATLERALREFDLVYGFPNPKALPVVKRVGYSALGDIVRLTRVLRYGPYLERVMPRIGARVVGFALDAADRCIEAWYRLSGRRLAARWSDRVDPRMNDLWERTRTSPGLFAVRDEAMLGWRFDAADFTRVRYLLVAESADGPPIAWFACQAEESMLHVRDFWSADATTGMSDAALHALVLAARGAGFASVSCESFDRAATLAPWLRARFRERSRRPIVGAWNERLSDAIRSALHLTSLDEDE